MDHLHHMVGLLKSHILESPTPDLLNQKLWAGGVVRNTRS